MLMCFLTVRHAFVVQHACQAPTPESRCDRSQAHLAWAEPEPDLVGVGARQSLSLGQPGHPEREQPIAVQVRGDLTAMRLHRGWAEQLRECLVCALVVVNALDLHSSTFSCQDFGR